jgi:hypothetical protein
MEGLGATIGVMYLGYRWSPVMTQNFWHDRFPPVASGWGTIQLILDMALPLQGEEGGPPT